jgi:hypothetical protein
MSTEETVTWTVCTSFTVNCNEFNFTAVYGTVTFRTWGVAQHNERKQTRNYRHISAAALD